ncbi:MAG: CRTAC1 family protein [bacterium]|nr:CRTAC1 family protein [bacterium]
MARSSSTQLLALVIWLHAPLPLPAQGADVEIPGAPSSDETRRELEAVCTALRAGRNSYFGQAEAKELQQRLKSSELPAAEEARARRDLAHALLREGKNEDAVTELSRALQIAAEHLPIEAQLVLLEDLGLANLRLGEAVNCVGHHRPGMCLLPIGEAGRHIDRRGSSQAMRAYLGVLAGIPGNQRAKWLLNIAAMTLGRYPDGVPPEHLVPPEAMRSAHDVGRFADVAHAAGLAIHDTAGGAVMDDFDGDGLYDVITTAVEPCTPMRFFGLTQAGTFENSSAASGLEGQLGGSNLIHADVDNDGDRDLYVIRGGWFGPSGRIRNSLLLNDGTGRFTDVTRLAGLAEPAFPAQSAAFADVDLDGDLDLFVANERFDLEQTIRSQLFLNDGPGEDGLVTFTDVAERAGVLNGRYAKGTSWGDYDNDGDPDLYVSNLGPNRLYRNDGPGTDGKVTFTDVAERAGVTEPAGRSFPTWWFDYDNDGWLDLFVAAYGARTPEIAAHFLDRRPSDEHPRLFRNLGPDSGGEVRFADVSSAVGLTAPSLPMGVNFGDLDNDGWLDFYLGTGIPEYHGLMPNLMYRNDGGRRFQDVTYSGGFGHLQKGHGIAFADLDGDGDQDVFEQMGGVYAGDAFPSALYENPGHGHRWLQLELVGRRSNRDCIGSRITVTVIEDGAVRRIHRQVGTGGSFGGSPLRQEIGLGDAERIAAVEVFWPASGLRQRFEDVTPDRRYRLIEGDDTLKELEVRRLRLGGPSSSASSRNLE